MHGCRNHNAHGSSGVLGSLYVVDSGPEFPQVLSCVLDALQVGLQRATELIDELIKRPDVTCKQVAVTHVSRLSDTMVNSCKCCTAGGGGLTIITL